MEYFWKHFFIINKDDEQKFYEGQESGNKSYLTRFIRTVQYFIPYSKQNEKKHLILTKLLNLLNREKFCQFQIHRSKVESIISERIFKILRIS